MPPYALTCSPHTDHTPAKQACSIGHLGAQAFFDGVGCHPPPPPPPNLTPFALACAVRRFYGNDEFGARLFDADCNPQWGTDVPMYLWDAGTAQNQPFWANLNTGQDSRQLYGGSRHLGQRPEAALIRQVLDAEITNVNDTYPLPSNLLRVTIEPGVDVRLFPLINSYKGANATVEVNPMPKGAARPRLWMQPPLSPPPFHVPWSDSSW